MRRMLVPAAVAALALAACSEGEGAAPAPERRPDAADATEASPGGGADAAAGCVEEYSPETLANREFAFDGTLTGLDPAPVGDRVTFRINDAYHGDVSGEVTLRTSIPAGAVTSAGSLELTEGDRYLVAGDDDFAWACGFTQPYSAEAAAEWEAVFEG